MSQQAVSLVETGRCRRLSLATLERILGSLEAEAEVIVRWRGGELDRLVDEAHAGVVAAVVELLASAGWLVQVEVTYSIGRERGSVDALAFHPGSRAIVVVEVKADITSAEATLRRHDEKVRLAARIARDRFGWETANVSRLLVLPDASTPRRRIAAHAAVFDRAYPLRGHDLRRWLRSPDGATAGLLFLSVTNVFGGRRVLTSRRRVQLPRSERENPRSRSGSPPSTPGFIDSSGEHHTDW